MAASFPGTPEPLLPPSSRRRRGRDRDLSVLGAPTTWPESVLRRAPPRRWRTWVVLATVVASVGALAIPLALALYFGSQDRDNYLVSQAVEHYQRALAYEAENYTELAVAELQIALKFNPQYGPAQDKLRVLQNGTNGSATPVPNEITIADQLFQRAQTAIAQKQWSEAIDSLEEIRRVKPDLRANEVKTLLIQAYLNGGKESITAGQIDQARASFDAILELDSANAEATSLRAQALLYLNASHAVDLDWQTAALNFQQLYDLNPNFYDVKQQLSNALINYGDLAAAQNAYCIAAREYDRARSLGFDDSAGAKFSAASAQCKQVVTAPTPTPTVAAPIGEGQFAPAGHVDPAGRCEGTGAVSGIVRDAQGNPLAGVAVQIYNDGDYRPSPIVTQLEGTYVFVLGKDAGMFHLNIVNGEGKAASAVFDVTYPGGAVSGCQWIVDWTRIA